MNLVELKRLITSGIVPHEFLIFVCKDNQFLAKQYIQAIGKIAAGGITKIKSIYEPQQSSFMLLTSADDVINVLYTDTFDECSEDYEQFSNTIVVCTQVDKSIVKNVENYIIKLPKFEEWQICAYAKKLCPALADEDINWLVKASDNDIERVINELDKVALFSKEDQNAIFSTIRYDTKSDLYKFDLFTIVNAVIDGNLPVLLDFLRHDDYSNIEPVVIANRALVSLKNILFVTQPCGLTTDDYGVSAGQYKVLVNKYRNLNVEAVKYKIKFLSDFDLKLKTSKLDLSKRDMLSYLISNLSFKITR